MITQKLQTSALVEKIDGKMLAIASDGVVDRQGESLNPDGWDLKNFKKNPVLLWAHNPSDPPIGVAEKIKLQEIEGKKRLTFIPKFHDITELARTVAKLFEAGVMKTFSVGFLPLETDGNQYLKQELLEISAVPVPANPNAMVIAKELKLDEDVVSKILMPKKVKKSKEHLKIYQILEKMDKKLDAVAEIKSQPADNGRTKTPDDRMVKVRRALQVMNKAIEIAFKETKK